MNEDLETRLWKKPYQTPLSPSPLENRDCKCGCGNLFSPKRRDQVYLNSQHANYGYNHGRRKEKNQKSNNINKKLLGNDRVLEKFFNAYNGNPIVAPLINLKVGGFIDSLYLSINNENNETYYFLYHYGFSIYVKDNQKLVKIFKLKKNESI